ncbi:MAG: PorV/PorQ family protein [candidate division Zixibacteria bacterium]|nr:PorV/PorQ family protein [candidate division Zixibacteria bacterium]
MLTRIAATLVIVCLAVTCLTTSGYSQISSASALFLKIAPGARAGGMGEAFVAVADDATTTHWNPAGLGAYPLSDSWKDAEVPQYLRPLRSMAALKRGGGSDYQSYEIWAISAQGLVRYDNREWHTKEIFTTSTKETVARKVSRYFNVSDDDERLKAMVAVVAEANSKISRQGLLNLRDTVIAAIPEDFSRLSELTDSFDSLVTAYNKCRINWELFKNIQQNYAEGFRDSVLSEVECDRIKLAVEKAKSRFIPEELKIPYTTLFQENLSCIASNRRALLVGSSDGLYVFNGKSWRVLTEEDGLPSSEILSLYVSPDKIYVGTSSGMVTFNMVRIESVPAAETLPNGSVTAISCNHFNIWAVVDNELYHYDGETWSNSFEYTVKLDENLKTIADKFTIYGSEAEKQELITGMISINQQSSEPTSESDLPQDNEVVPAHEKIVEEDIGKTAEAETVNEIPEVSDSTASADVGGMPPRPVDINTLNPGDVIRVPYVVKIRGNATSIHSSDGWIWIGTDYGLVLLYGDSSRILGYSEHVVTEGETLDSLVSRRKRVSSDAGNLYRQALIAVNNLNDETLHAGDTIKVYRNAVASRINQITAQGQDIYLATADGLRCFDKEKKKVMTVNQRGMGNANAIHVESMGDELWLASDERVVSKANAQSEFSLMHVNWLPELNLADDIYYEFFSGIHHFNGWGTMGFNFTYLTYGSMPYTNETGQQIGTGEAFELAFSLAYGTSLTRSLKGGIAAKIIYSRLSEQGELAGNTQGGFGNGTATGVAVDLGLLYHITPRFNLGMSVTDIGPDIQYSQDAQSDPLPRNLAVGFAYKLLQSDYTQLLVTAEANKMVVSIGNFREEVRELILNAGAEFVYSDLIALRAGYKYDEEGEIKILTLGLGLTLMERFGFDFSYIPSNNESILANTLRMSLSIKP